jgi:cytochrome c oxidase subunit 2
MSHGSHSQASGTLPPVFDTTSKIVAIVIGFVAVVAGLVVGLNNPLLHTSVATEGNAIDRLFSLTLGIATVVFVVVQGFLLYSIVRFGREPGDETDGPPMRGNTRLEFFWTLIPALTIFFVGFVSYVTLSRIETRIDDALEVEVKAFQFAWQFYYPEEDVTSAELHVPVDRQIHLKMRSNDVVHSFWVPEMRIKKDVMPDRVTETYITPTEPGTYPIVCTELCGAGHAVMRSNVVVQSDAAYRAWLASQKTTAEAAAEAANDPLAQGRGVFVAAGCNACHALADANAVGAIGPKLDGFGTVAAERVPGQSAEEYTLQSIVKPNELVVEGYPANVMPQDYGLRLSEQELDALVKYLVEMK